MNTNGVNWPSVTIVLFFLAISIGTIAGARASGYEGLTLVGVLAAVMGGVLVLVLKIEKPTHFAVIPQVILILFVVIGAAVIMLVEWEPKMGVVVGAAYGAIFSLALGWNYAQSLRENRENSDEDCRCK